MIDFDKINPMEELAKMTSEEQAIVVQFLTKLQDAFNIVGIEKLANSESEACRAIFDLYEQINAAIQ